MNWIDTALALGSGILAVALTSLLVRRPAQRRGTYALVLLILFVTLQGLGREYLFPRLNAWNNVREAESLPGLAPLKRADPEAYAGVLAYVRGALDRAVDRGTVRDMVDRRLNALARRRLPSTSNEAAMAYLGAVLAEMKAAEVSDPPGGARCYGILDRGDPGLPTGQLAIPATLRARDLAARAQVIAAATRNPQPVPGESDVMAVLRPIDARLRRAGGGDAVSLRFPNLPPFDEPRACSIDARLFADILALPVNRGGPVVRYLWSRLPRD